ncbi:MAG: hypothetical protein ACXV8O_11240 [Methylobacter sp.]
MNNLFTLHPVRHDPIAEVPLPVHPGYRYRMMVPEHSNHLIDTDYQHSGIIGAYRLSAESADIEPVDLHVQPPQCFVWDTDYLSPSVSAWLQSDPEQPRSTHPNCLTIMEAALAEPEVRLSDKRPVLSISPRFELEWSTAAFASQLGLVQLVESSRTLQFEDGESLVLLDTESANTGPVLYLSDPADNLAVKPVCAFQQRGDKKRFGFTTEVTQVIPAEFKGKAVVSVSVLEKYTWYFMQNAAPDDAERHIWTPVHLPVVWGWSIRVQQRHDGEWDVFRKKLIMPTSTTEDPRLPRWHSNTLLCRAITGD